MSGSRDEIDEGVLRALRQIIQAIDLHSRKLIKECGLTGPQLIVLGNLSRSGESPVGELARDINLRHATVTRILDRLEKRELVVRKRSDHDKRKVMADITEKGRKVLETAPSPLHERFLSEFGTLLEWEKSLVLSSLQRIASMMQAEEIEAAPVLVSGPIAATEKKTGEFLDGMNDSDDSGGGKAPPSKGRK